MAVGAFRSSQHASQLANGLKFQAAWDGESACKIMNAHIFVFQCSKSGINRLYQALQPGVLQILQARR